MSDDDFALHEALKLLRGLDLSEPVRSEAKKFLTLVLGREATIPSIAPGEDKGDVSLYWRTGPMSLEVEISQDGPHYLWACDETGDIHCLDSDRRGIIELAKNIVLRMGVRAQLHNPHWRLQYNHKGERVD